MTIAARLKPMPDHPGIGLFQAGPQDGGWRVTARIPV